MRARQWPVAAAAGRPTTSSSSSSSSSSRRRSLPPLPSLLLLLAAASLIALGSLTPALAVATADTATDSTAAAATAAADSAPGDLMESVASFQAGATAAAAAPDAAAATADSAAADGGGGAFVARAPQQAAAAGVNTSASVQGPDPAANQTITQECAAYTAAPGRPGDTSLTVRSADGSAVTSVLLVADDLGGPNGTAGARLGAVEVRDVVLRHPRLGGLVMSLLWLPYDDDAGALAAAAASPRLLDEGTGGNSSSGVSVVIKEARQGGSGSDLAGASFSDSAPGGGPMSYWAAAGNASANYTPATPLSTFGALGTPSRGRWALVVEDVRAGANASRVSPVLLQWTLVLCPPLDSPPPTWLTQLMQQQAANPGAVGLLGGGSLRGGLGAAGVFGAGGGLFGAGGGGGRLGAASPVATRATVTATTAFKPYSALADEAVASAVRGYANFQTLFGLPYQPKPLINQWLPWVELLTGGTDATIQNRVWPGKIVYYALQTEIT
ncbi:hypothetical protein CHLRE_07g356980v5 [Chlamydomonas reinhardtii]|uniref:Uncharacterized protein n=1 Tax=Chlamydomonas reinhardtii TaxID=3055 RepID=A0A2K3DLS0_CHLRE|nr:uncharacterized protein CHLRE_07g356980v5 [Chlamydomonas reinhardtii]PNW81461.1 hypothetical protein CHLRE_07g356980v5 [Chlamydomonas reinhardtii]